MKMCLEQSLELPSVKTMLQKSCAQSQQLTLGIFPLNPVQDLLYSIHLLRLLESAHLSVDHSLPVQNLCTYVHTYGSYLFKNPPRLPASIGAALPPFRSLSWASGASPPLCSSYPPTSNRMYAAYLLLTHSSIYTSRAAGPPPPLSIHSPGLPSTWS
jgi:hypothetical protein